MRPNGMVYAPKAAADKAIRLGVPAFSAVENLAITRAALEVSERGETNGTSLDAATGEAFSRHLQLLLTAEGGGHVFDVIDATGK